MPFGEYHKMATDVGRGGFDRGPVTEPPTTTTQPFWSRDEEWGRDQIKSKVTVNKTVVTKETEVKKTYDMNYSNIRDTYPMPTEAPTEAPPPPNRVVHLKIHTTAPPTTTRTLPHWHINQTEITRGKGAKAKEEDNGAMNITWEVPKNEGGNVGGGAGGGGPGG